MAPEEIADELNEERVPTLFGTQKWWPSSVQTGLRYWRAGSVARLEQTAVTGEERGWLINPSARRDTDTRRGHEPASGERGAVISLTRLDPLRRRRVSAYRAGPGLDEALDVCRRLGAHGLASHDRLHGGARRATARGGRRAPRRLRAPVGAGHRRLRLGEAVGARLRRRAPGRARRGCGAVGADAPRGRARAGDGRRRRGGCSEGAPRAGDVGIALPGRWTRSVHDAELAEQLGLRVRVVKGQWADRVSGRRRSRRGLPARRRPAAREQPRGGRRDARRRAARRVAEPSHGVRDTVHGRAVPRHAVSRAGARGSAIGGSDSRLRPLRSQRRPVRRHRHPGQSCGGVVAAAGSGARKGQDVAEHPTVTSETLTMPEPPSDSIPWVNSVFEQPWWLDCVAPGSMGRGRGAPRRRGGRPSALRRCAGGSG